MHIRRKPKLIAVLFIGGTTVLIGGAAVAASLSPPDSPMHLTAARGVHSSTTSASGGAAVTSATVPTSPLTSGSPRPTRKPVSPPETKKKPRRTAPKAPITYTVRAGDTLSGIAGWFKLHGYGDLYAANARVIGTNPNVIHPGERITITSGVMKVRGPA